MRCVVQALVFLPDWKGSLGLVSVRRVVVLHQSVRLLASCVLKSCLHYSILRTLLNQSDISDLVEKSFSSCDCISRAANQCQIVFSVSQGPNIVPANLALLSSDVNDGLSPIARVPHHVKSCFIRRGSESPSLSMCL